MPNMPLLEEFGSIGTVSVWQILAVVPKLNVGIVKGNTETVSVEAFAHCGTFSINEISSNEKSLPFAWVALSKISICAVVFEPEFH